MNKLQSGTVIGLQEDTLAGQMDKAFRDHWAVNKDIDLPTDPNITKDRHIMFVAIAQGMLKYLHDHRSDIGTSEESAGGIVSSEHDHQLEFDWEA